MDLTIEGADTIIADFGEYPMRVNRAMVRALNRSIASGRTVMVRKIARNTGLRSKDVRDAMRMDEASLSRPEARLGTGIKRIPLLDFQARQTARGVSYNLGRGRQTLAGAFIATMKSGHNGVFMRMTKKRLPIRELLGPSLGHVFAKYRPLGIARVQEVFEQNLDHELDFAKSQAGADAGGPD